MNTRMEREETRGAREGGIRSVDLKMMKLPSIRALFSSSSSFFLLSKIWRKMVAVSAGNGPRLRSFLGFGAVGIDLIWFGLGWFGV